MPQHHSRAIRQALLAGIALVTLLGLRVSIAAPSLQTAATCTWQRLATGDKIAQHSLVGVPDVGVLAFGGADVARDEISDDLSLLDMTGGGMGEWRPLNAAGSGPGTRADHAAVLREPAGASAQMIAYGGLDSLPDTGGGTFAWRSPLLPGGSVSGSRRGAFELLRVRDDAYRLHLDLDNPAWEKVDASGGPRTDHSAVWFPDEDALIVFGGRTDEEETDRTNALSRLTLGDDPEWSTRDAGRGPNARFSHSAVYDPTRKQMLVFGGTADWQRSNNEVWALDLSGGWEAATWSEVETLGTISGRYAHGAVYLPQLDWMVVFGGTANGRSERDDVYALDLGAETPTWIKLSPDGQKPPGLKDVAAAYDPVTQAAIFQGGLKDDQTDRFTWSLSCVPDVPPTEVPTEPPPATDTATAEPPTDTPDAPTPTDTPEPPTDTPVPSTATDTVEPTVAPEPEIYLPWLGNGE